MVCLGSDPRRQRAIQTSIYDIQTSVDQVGRLHLDSELSNGELLPLANGPARFDGSSSGLAWLRMEKYSQYRDRGSPC